MARNLMGCTTADVAVAASNGALQPGSGPWPVYTTGPYRDTSVAITDLTDMAGNPVSQVTFGADGVLRYYSPDGDTSTHWLDVGQGLRIAVRPVDITGETGPTPDLSIGTVTTGTAAATLTGTTDEPVLNLVLPSAGADGVNTAAIQDDAVTTAKIADGAVTPQQISGVGNLLTRNQASGGDTLGDTTGFAGTNASTVARITSTSASGTGCIEATAEAAGANITAGTPRPWQGTAVAVTPNEIYTFSSSVKYTSGSRSTAAMLVIWWTAAGGVASQVQGPTVSVGTSAFATIACTGVAPSNAVAVSIEPMMTSTGAVGDKMAIDNLGMWKGTGGRWSMPGEPILGLEDGLGKIGNLLTRNQANLQADTTGWESYGFGTLTQSTANPSSLSFTHGRIVMTGASPSAVRSIPTVAVTAGETYTLRIELSSASTKTADVRLVWQNAAGTDLSSMATARATTTEYQTYQVTGTAPSTAAKAYIFIALAGAASGDTLDFTGASVHRGAGGAWSPLNLPIVGQSAIRHNGSYDLSGLGSPEGVIAAPVGSTFTQTDSLTALGGILVWRKRSGTGTTGWVVVEGETPWYTVPMLNGWSGALKIKRIGGEVHVSLYNLNASGATNDIFYTLPTGFRHDLLAIFPWGNAGAKNWVVRSTGNLDSSARDASLYGYAVFASPYAWPTVAP